MVGNKEMPMKYPIIVVGNVRYAPYAVMEMRGDEGVSFTKVTGTEATQPQKWSIKYWLKKLTGNAEGSVCRRTNQCRANTSRF